ncbi:MAG TPA: hypothetical protein VHO68_06080 [Bacteroidales bacterium]|jgi:hypothetical protein|nr:hypothetical protein [Bacteroidales bacterium]
MIKVVGIKIIDRIKEAGLTQGILSKHASVITTRLGFHEVTEAVCSREAIIVLHLNANPDESESLIRDLESLEGIEIREAAFSSTPEIAAEEAQLPEVLCILLERNPSVIGSVQRMLTAFGCNIRTRLGVNETFFGEPAGLIILELTGEAEQRLLLEKDLRALPGVHMKAITF